MPVVYLVGGCLTCCSSYRLSFNVITIYGVVCVQLARLRWPNRDIYRLCHYHHQSGSINKDFFNTIVQFMLSSNSRIRFGLQIAFVFLYKTPSHYHHCANLSEEIELIKYLSDIFCRVCKIEHILSVIHYAIYGAVCYQFVHPPCDDWDNIYYLMMIIRQSIYYLIHYKKYGQTDNKSGLTTAPIGSQSKKPNHSSTYLRADGVTKAAVFSISLCVVAPMSKELPLGKSHSAARDVIWISRGNSKIFGRGTATSSTTKWFLQLPPEYILTATVFEISVD